MIRCKCTLAEIEIHTCSKYIGGSTCNDYLSDQQLLPLPIEDLADNTPTCVYNIYKQEAKIRKAVIKEIHSWPFMNCIGCANMNENAFFWLRYYCYTFSKFTSVQIKYLIRILGGLWVKATELEIVLWFILTFSGLKLLMSNKITNPLLY